MNKIILPMLSLLVAGTALSADPVIKSNPIYAQKLADEFTAKYVDLISVGMHAKPPNASDYVIVAHTITAKVGNKSEDEDIDAMRTGKPNGPNPVEGSIWDVILPLQDASGNTIGTLVLHVKPPYGQGAEDGLKLAYKYRDLIAKRIPSEAKLFEPAK